MFIKGVSEQTSGLSSLGRTTRMSTSLYFSRLNDSPLQESRCISFKAIHSVLDDVAKRSQMSRTIAVASIVKGQSRWSAF